MAAPAAASAAAETGPPRKTAGTRSTPWPRFFSITTLIAAPPAPRTRSACRARWSVTRCRRLPANIQTIPAIAIADRQPGPRRNRRLQHGPREKRRQQRRNGEDDQRVRRRRQCQRQHEADEHRRPHCTGHAVPAAPGAPDRSPTRSRRTNSRIPADRERGEQAAPERDLEASLRLQLRRQMRVTTPAMLHSVGAITIRITARRWEDRKPRCDVLQPPPSGGRAGEGAVADRKRARRDAARQPLAGHAFARVP